MNLNPRKAVTLRRQTRNLFVIQAAAQRNGFKILRFTQKFFKAANVARLDAHDFCQLSDELIHIVAARLDRCDFERIGRVIACQYDAVAVEYPAPVRHNRHNGGAIAFGLF